MPKKKKEKSASPKLGAQYQAAKLGVQVISPLTNSIVVRGADPNQIAADMRTNATSPGPRSAYIRGAAVSGLDYWASKKIGHAGALSRKSVTALAPEVYAVGTSATNSQLEPQALNAEFVATTSGYDPRGLAFSFSKPETRTYFAMKYGGFLLRKALQVTRLDKPISSFLGKFGGAI